MAEFNELIKNFERVREYMRQFYVYGFKVRMDFTDKSPRTYDNERRRVESLLSQYIYRDYSVKGKRVAILVDSKRVAQNPLYAAWKSKSFTDNDIMLHFFLLDLLKDESECTAVSLTDQISVKYGVVFDLQTVRLKLKEYEDCKIIHSRKEGKLVYYQIEPLLPFENEQVFGHLLTAVKLFQEEAPFGFVGSTILDREGIDNNLFCFKHHFIMHTLEDGVLYDLLAAMKENKEVTFCNRSTRSGLVTQIRGIPLKIFVSTQTGRRYVCLYLYNKRRFINMRLDSISQVKALEVFKYYHDKKKELDQNLHKCWGVCFDGNFRIEEVFMKLHINEQTEEFILNRLHREGRGGEVIRVCENTFLYSGAFFDSNEMLPWVKTFIGRIMDIQGSNQYAIGKVLHDIKRMHEMYCAKED